jgi:hypothetical protein
MCGIFGKEGRNVVTGADQALVKKWRERLPADYSASKEKLPLLHAKRDRNSIREGGCAHFRTGAASGGVQDREGESAWRWMLRRP